jgi:hypothetical protein
VVIAMDPDTRRMIDDLIARADQSAAEYELWRAEFERRNAPNNSASLIVKDFPTERQLAHASVFAPSQTALSDLRDELCATINRRLETVVDVCASEVGLTEKRIRADLRKEFATELRVLRSEIECLRAIVKGNASRNVVAYLDENLRSTDIDHSKFVKVEVGDTIELLKIMRPGTRKRA